MQVHEVMSAPVRAVRTLDRLDAAARLLWDGDCGFCPVVDGSGELVGVLTDRDVCMAAFTQGRTLAEIPVAAVMSRHLRACRHDDPVSVAMEAMAQVQVHRLPVIDARGRLVGVLSSSDLLQVVGERPAALDAGKVLRTLAQITAPRRERPRREVAELAAAVPTAAVPAAAVPPPAAAVAAAGSASSPAEAAPISPAPGFAGPAAAAPLPPTATSKASKAAKPGSGAARSRASGKGKRS